MNTAVEADPNPDPRWLRGLTVLLCVLTVLVLGSLWLIGATAWALWWLARKLAQWSLLAWFILRSAAETLALGRSAARQMKETKGGAA